MFVSYGIVKVLVSEAINCITEYFNMCVEINLPSETNTVPTTITSQTSKLYCSYRRKVERKLQLNSSQEVWRGISKNTGCKENNNNTSVIERDLTTTTSLTGSSICLTERLLHSCITPFSGLSTNKPPTTSYTPGLSGSADHHDEGDAHALNTHVHLYFYSLE